MAEDFFEKLNWIQEELLMEEPEVPEDPEDETEEDEIFRPGKNLAVDFSRGLYEDEDSGEPFYAAPPEKKGVKRTVLLAVFELLALGAMIGWWIQWQN